MDYSKSHRQLNYRKVGEIWQEGQLLEAQGLSAAEISPLVGMGVGNWSRLKRLVLTSFGEMPYGTNPETRELAKQLVKGIDSGELSFFVAFHAFAKHLAETKQVPQKVNSPKIRGANKKAPDAAQLTELYRRAVLAVEGTAYALTKLPDWPDGYPSSEIEEYTERLAKARKVIEQKINVLRRAISAQAQG